MREAMRDVLDGYTRQWVERNAESGGWPNADLTAARMAVRAAARMIAVYEGGYPTRKMIHRAEQMSVARVKHGKTERHTCGALILANDMCDAGHDPAKPSRSV